MKKQLISFRFALFFRRFAALLLDLVIVTTLLLPVLYALYGPDYFHWRGVYGWNLLDPALVYRIDEFLLTTILPLMLLVFCWHRWGATPGKMLMSLRIVDVRTGHTPDLKQCIIRLFGYFLSLFVFYLGFLWSLWNRKQQGWHDLLAHTRVIYEPGYERETLESLIPKKMIPKND